MSPNRFCLFFKLFPAPDKCCGERKRKEGKGNFLLVYKKFVNSADGVCRVIFEPQKIVFITLQYCQTSLVNSYSCFVLPFMAPFIALLKLFKAGKVRT